MKIIKNIENPLDPSEGFIIARKFIFYYVLIYDNKFGPFFTKRRANKVIKKFIETISEGDNDEVS